MASVFTGRVSCAISGKNTLSGNETGEPTFGQSYGNDVGVSAVSPAVESGGGYAGSFTAVTGGTLLNLAHSTNIVISGGTGPVGPAQGYVITAAKKLRSLYLENTDAAIVVTVSIPGSNGLAGCGFSAGEHVVTLQPKGVLLLVFPTGSSVLTAGSNDGITATSASGTPSVKIAATFG